jgi:hypothetical protein
MAGTINARAMAQQVSAALAKLGHKPVDAKRVRAWVRENVPAYDDDGYTAHAYDARTAAAIVKGMTARYVAAKNATETDARGTAASSGRTPSTRKPRSRKPASATTAQDAQS